MNEIVVGVVNSFCFVETVGIHRNTARLVAARNFTLLFVGGLRQHLAMGGCLLRS
jgi:hypothetical protein